MRRVAVIGADDDIGELVEAIRAVRDAKAKGDVKKHEEVSESRCDDGSFGFVDVDSCRMSSDSSRRKWWRKFAK